MNQYSKIKRLFPWVILLFLLSCFKAVNASSIDLQKCQKTAQGFIDFLDIKKEYSDPHIIDDLITNIFHMGDFQSKHFSFGPVKERQPLIRTTEIIIDGLTKHHPATCQFINSIPENFFVNLTREEKSLVKKQFSKLIHHTILLEYIVSQMTANPKLIIEIYAHMSKKREEFNINYFNIYNNFDFFSAIKTFSMDWAYEWVLDKHKIGEVNDDPVDSKGCGTYASGLAMNIFEATLSDLFKLNLDNSLVGMDLTANSYAYIHFNRKENKDVKINFNIGEEWISLYESWNLAFVAGNLKYANLLLPKLLIPSVIAVPHEEFFYGRILSLWLSINIYVLAGELNLSDDFFIPRKEELIKLWGESNIKYLKANKDAISRCNTNKLPNENLYLNSENK